MKKVKNPRLLLPRFMRSRWFSIGVVAAIVLGGSGVYIWWSQDSWGAYEKKYLNVRHDIDAKLIDVFSMRSDTTQERQEKTARLAKLSVDIEEMGDAFCNQNALIGWQTAFGEYKQHKESCRATVVAIRAFNDQLRPAVEYLQQEHALAKQLSAAPAQAEVAEGDFERQLAAWRSIYEGLKNASASSDFDPIKQAAIGGTEGIVKNWEEVIAAHQAKDKARYLKATQALAAAYDTLQVVASTSNTHLTEVAMRLKEAYGKPR